MDNNQQDSDFEIQIDFLQNKNHSHPDIQEALDIINTNLSGGQVREPNTALFHSVKEKHNLLQLMLYDKPITDFQRSLMSCDSAIKAHFNFARLISRQLNTITMEKY